MTPKVGDIFWYYSCGAELKVIGVKSYNSYPDIWAIDYVVYDSKGCKVCKEGKTKVSSIYRRTKEYSYYFIRNSNTDTEIL